MFDSEDKYINDIIERLREGFNSDEENIKTTKVELKPLWSLFKYVYTPKAAYYSEFNPRPGDVYFTIPMGAVSEEGNYHYLIFPAFGKNSDIQEICYNYLSGSISVIDEESL